MKAKQFDAPIDRILSPPGNNPNVMQGEQQKRLDRAIEDEGGLLQPVLLRPLPADLVPRAARDGKPWWEVVDGEHRLASARAAGLTHVAAIEKEMTTERARALRLGMNRLRGELDFAAAAEQIAELRGAGWTTDELEITGFGADEIEELLRVAQPTTEDIMAGGAAPPPVEAEPDSDANWLLELRFESKALLSRAKRGLRKIAGKKGSMGAALLKLLDD